MRHKAKFLLISVALAAGAVLPVRGDVNLGLSADENGLRSFYLGIGDYYHVPEREVYVIHDRGIPDEDLPVVYYLAQRTGAAPGAIVDLRLRGWSWQRITFYLGAGPDIYYMPVPVAVVGPPYGRAYGFYRSVPRARWRTIQLSDDDVVNLVNLRFVSQYRHLPPQRVMELRREHPRFTDVYFRTGGGPGGERGPREPGGPRSGGPRGGEGNGRGGPHGNHGHGGHGRH